MTQNKHKHKNNIKRPMNAVYCAMCGLKTIFKEEIAFRQEAIFTIVITPLALILGKTAIEKVILISSWTLILLMEVINSSIETVVDRISLDIHPISKKIKDMSSAAVLLSFINAIVVWIIILI